MLCQACKCLWGTHEDKGCDYVTGFRVSTEAASTVRDQWTGCRVYQCLTQDTSKPLAATNSEVSSHTCCDLHEQSLTGCAASQSALAYVASEAAAQFEWTNLATYRYARSTALNCQLTWDV